MCNKKSFLYNLSTYTSLHTVYGRPCSCGGGDLAGLRLWCCIKNAAFYETCLAFRNLLLPRIIYEAMKERTHQRLQSTMAYEKERDSADYRLNSRKYKIIFIYWLFFYVLTKMQRKLIRLHSIWMRTWRRTNGSLPVRLNNVVLRKIST